MLYQLLYPLMVFSFGNYSFKSLQLRSHLTVDTTAELRRQLSNMNVIFNKRVVFFPRSNILRDSSNQCIFLVHWLTHWGWATHKCVSKLTIIGPDNGLSPGRRQAIIWTNAGILLIRILRTNFNEILSDIHSFSFKKIPWKCRLENGVHFVSASMC